MKKNSITPDMFIGEALVQAQLRLNRLDSQETRMYAMVRNDFTKMGVRIEDVDPIDDSVVLAKDTTVENEMDMAQAKPSPSRIAASAPTAPTSQPPRTERTGLTLRVNTDEFVRKFMLDVGRTGRSLSDVRNENILVSADAAISTFDPAFDILALRRIARIIQDIYGKFQRLLAATDATEKALTPSLHREIVSALRARGPYSGSRGYKISMM